MSLCSQDNFNCFYCTVLYAQILLSGNGRDMHLLVTMTYDLRDVYASDWSAGRYDLPVTATHRTHYHGLSRTAQARLHTGPSQCESILLFPVFSYLSLLLKCITMIQDNLKYKVSKVYFIVGIYVYK